MHAKKLSLLIVEDNEVNQQLAFDTIKEWNPEFMIVLANNGEDAIGKVKENHFDVILMDIQMPIMDGYKATQSIRQLPSPKCLIPIIAMTAHALEDEKEKCIAAGLNDFLSKPFKPIELYKKIRRFTCIEQLKRIQKGLAIDPTIACKYDTNSETFYVEKGQNEFRQKPQLSLDYLNKLYKGNTQKILKMLKIFSETIPKEIDLLSHCYANREWENLKIKAHSLKPTMIYLGLPEFHNAAKELEFLAKEQQDDMKIELNISYLQDVWKDIQLELQNKISKFEHESL